MTKAEEMIAEYKAGIHHSSSRPIYLDNTPNYGGIIFVVCVFIIGGICGRLRKK